MEPNESTSALRNARPGHHDVAQAALGGTPALSPLTLRLRLAVFGLVVCLAGLVVFGAVLHVTPIAVAFGVALAVVAVTGLVDLVVIQRRRRGGEPG